MSVELSRADPERKVRYAVVGAGWISQVAFMPAVAKTGNSALTALVTGDHRKAEALGARYRVDRVYHYDAYQAALESRGFDAVYIAVPNAQHRAFAVPALERGLHVLVEKPMATSEGDAWAMIEASRRGGGRLMVAYRLHFEPATLEAMRIAHSGALGRLTLLTSTLSQGISEENHRAQSGFWAGPAADLGPYPINAARMLFRAEPIEVSAWGIERLGFGFHDTIAVTLRFPEDRLAQFTVGYGLEGSDGYALVGDEGRLLASPAFTFSDAIGLEQWQAGRRVVTPFRAVDQFAGMIAAFSDCVLEGREPEPDGEEGLLDVRVVAAIERSLSSGRTEVLAPAYRRQRPLPDQGQDFPTSASPPLVHAAAPTG